MNNTERVAALEALLGRIQKNASRPPVSWRADGNGNGHAAVEIAVEPAASPAPPPAAARAPAPAPSSPARAPVAAQPAQPAKPQQPVAAKPAAQPVAPKPAAAAPAARSALPSSPRVDPRAEPLGTWAEEGEGTARQTLPEDRAARLAALGRDSSVPAQKMKVTVPVGGRPVQGAGIKGFGSNVQRTSTAGGPVKEEPAIAAAPVFSVEGSNEPMDAPVPSPAAPPVAPTPSPVPLPVTAQSVSDIDLVAVAESEPKPAEHVERLLADVPPVPQPSMPDLSPELGLSPGAVTQENNAPAILAAALESVNQANDVGRATQPGGPISDGTAAPVEPIAPIEPVAPIETTAEAIPAAKPSTPKTLIDPVVTAAEPPPSFSSASEDDVKSAGSKFLREEPAQKPRKSLVPTLLVLAFVALLVGAGVFWWLNRDPGTTVVPSQDSKAGPTAPTSTAKATASGAVTASASASVAASASATPSASDSAAASASASASTSASAEGSEASPPKDPKSLAADLGYVFVKFDGEGDVVALGGKRVGKVNTWLEVGCKVPTFLSIAKPNNPPKGGRSVRVNCQDKQILTFTAADLAVPAGPLPQPPTTPTPTPPTAPPAPLPPPVQGI